MFSIPHLKQDRGGATFIEVLATFVMVAAAVVSTTYSLFFGQRTLATDMHKQQVLRMVEQETEYWVGRIYTGTPDDPNLIEISGATGSPYRRLTLDPDSKRPVEVRFYYDPIIERTSVVYGGGSYWVVTVWAEWTEPDGQEFSKAHGTEVAQTTYVSRPS